MIISVLIRSTDEFGNIFFWSTFNGKNTREALRRAKEEYSGSSYAPVDYREGKLSSGMLHQIFHSKEDATYAFDEELALYHVTPLLNGTMH